MSENERDPQADLALCEAATPGPWTGECGSLVNWRDDTFTMEFIPNRGGKPQYDADLSFMAMAREALPWYIRAYLAQRDELEQLRAENDSLHVVLQEANDTIERMSREQSEESALARLRAWRNESPKDRRWTREEDSGAPTLELYQHLGEYDSRYVCVASGDTFAMLVDAALAEWERKYGEGKPC